VSVVGSQSGNTEDQVTVGSIQTRLTPWQDTPLLDVLHGHMCDSTCTMAGRRQAHDAFSFEEPVVTGTLVERVNEQMND
jgi:hypothetical protein